MWKGVAGRARGKGCEASELVKGSHLTSPPAYLQVPCHHLSTLPHTSHTWRISIMSSRPFCLLSSSCTARSTSAARATIVSCRS